MTLPAPPLEHVCDLHVVAGTIETLGPVRTGTRRIVQIGGGTVTGPMINGTIEAAGADWSTVLADDATHMDARYLLRADDGALIEIVDDGFRRGPAEVMQRLAAGDEVRADEYYMRSSIRLESGDERYAWVNTTVFVGTGMRTATGVTISIYAVR